MPKMTTDQFLSHLGIEVEQEFTWSGDCSTKYRISKSYVLELYSDIFQKWLKSASDIKDLLDEEITPLPKYTLTEEDKTFIQSMKEDSPNNHYLTIVREEESKLIYIGDDCRAFIFLKPEMFKCIKENEEVSLDELRKCL